MDPKLRDFEIVLKIGKINSKAANLTEISDKQFNFSFCKHVQIRNTTIHNHDLFNRAWVMHD